MKTDVYADAESVAHEAAKIWFTWDSVRMATRLRWCRETRPSRSQVQMSHSRESTTDGGA